MFARSLLADSIVPFGLSSPVTAQGNFGFDGWSRNQELASVPPASWTSSGSKGLHLQRTLACMSKQQLRILSTVQIQLKSVIATTPSPS